MPCGIAGFTGPPDRKLLRSMCEVIKHRGPDETTFYEDGHVSLGVDRLSIIDLKTGSQPIHNEDQSVWAIQNGEIYNYKELMSDLETKGHRFYTESDTEVIVHAFEEWGESCLGRLRGMFALVVWDSRNQRLFLARDRFGKKPLYYSTQNGRLIFGSEMKAILEDRAIRRAMNEAAVDLYFTYGYVPSPQTIFEGISKLPPGHYAVYESGNLTINRYYEFELSPDEDLGEAEAIDKLYETLKEAVRLRLRSDVPWGAFLSGGIDSSTVVAFMSAISPEPVKTVSIGFNDVLSEVKYSRLVADYLGTDHKEYTVTPDAFRILPKLIWHFDEPFSDHSLIPTYYLSQVTRKEATVALSGDGGDEMFMGYGFLREPSTFGVYSKLPRRPRRAVLKTIRRLPIKGSITRQADHALEKDYGAQTSAERFAMRVTMLDENGLKKLYSASFGSRSLSEPYAYTTSIIQASGRKSELEANDLATVRTYLEEDILVKVDRMSMAASLEVRCPLLDQEVARLVGAIPTGLKFRRNQTKYILKKMALRKNLLPREVVQRRKQGFGAPIHSWMGRDWKEQSAQVLDPVLSSNYTGLFNRETVRKMLREPYVNSNRLFALMVFVMWHRMYVDEDKTLIPAQGLSAMA